MTTNNTMAAQTATNRINNFQQRSTRSLRRLINRRHVNNNNNNKSDDSNNNKTEQKRQEQKPKKRVRFAPDDVMVMERVQSKPMSTQEQKLAFYSGKEIQAMQLETYDMAETFRYRRKRGEIIEMRGLEIYTPEGKKHATSMMEIAVDTVLSKQKGFRWRLQRILTRNNHKHKTDTQEATEQEKHANMIAAAYEKVSQTSKKTALKRGAQMTRHG